MLKINLFDSKGGNFIKFLKERRVAQLDYIDKIQEDLALIRTDIINNGDKALSFYTMKYDKVSLKPEDLEVTEAEKNHALKEISSKEKTILENTSERVFDYHSKQVLKTWFNKEDSIITGQLVSPLDRVGIYVPGGKASYPSSVIMNAVPARAAGVKDIVMVTPPTEKLNVYVIAAAVICGVTRIFKAGGPHAVFALAYGTETIPVADKIVGPGNIYVATAKKMVYGDVDIDMIAGPSEIAIICDDSAEPDLVAMDMMSQAEHDEMAVSTLITHSGTVAEKVGKSLNKLIPKEPRKNIIMKSMSANASIVLTENLEESVGLANRLAPEHLELYVENPFDALFSVRNAGAVFLGKNTPESIGDYIAGPSHVLPTGGTARFFSPLDTLSFLKRTSVVYSSGEFLKEKADDIAFFSEVEGLSAHGNSVSMRIKKLKRI